VTVVFRSDADVTDLTAFGRVVSQSGHRLELFVPTDRVAELAGRLATLPIVDLLIEPQRLEDAFLEQYR
jgi:hypothetical protein